MTDTLSFRKEDAQAHGLLAAVIIHHVRYWMEYNLAEGRHIHEGRVWMYATSKGMADFLGIASQKQVQRCLKKLVDAEVLLVGRFNKVAYDRTLWYSLNGQFPIGQNCPMEDPDMSHRKDPGVQPIPVNTSKKVIKEKSKPKKKADQGKCEAKLKLPDGLDPEVWEDFLAHRKELKKPMTTRAQSGMLRKLTRLKDQGHDMNELLERSIINGWQGVFPERQQNGKQQQDPQVHGTFGNRRPVQGDEISRTFYG